MGINKVPDSIKTVEGYESPFVGFRFFLGKPKLWLIPLIGMLVAWFMLFCIFLFVTYKTWPSEEHLSRLHYTFKAIQAVGLGAMISLGVWVFIFPILLNLAFEQLIKKVYLAKGDILEPLPLMQMLVSGCYVLLKTLHWRLLWIVLGLIMIILYAPLTLFIFQLGIVHAALLDGCDLSLSVKGIGAHKRLELIRKHRLGILLGGIIGGLVSCILMPTVLIWLFWMPGVYVGACLWVREWI